MCVCAFVRACVRVCAGVYVLILSLSLNTLDALDTLDPLDNVLVSLSLCLCVSPPLLQPVVPFCSFFFSFFFSFGFFSALVFGRGEKDEQRSINGNQNRDWRLVFGSAGARVRQ